MPKIKGWTRTMATAASGDKRKQSHVAKKRNKKYGVFLRWEHDEMGDMIEIVKDDDQYEVYFDASQAQKFDTKKNAVDYAKRTMKDASDGFDENKSVRNFREKHT